MKKSFLIFAAVCIILVACGGNDKQVLIVSSETPAPLVIVMPTQIVNRSTSTPKPTLTPTIILPPPYPLKQVLVDYTEGGFHSVFEMHYADYGVGGWSKIVLYTDGQLIIPGKIYQQKILATDEVNQLLSKLEALGFYTIESNQRHDASDKLYNFGNQYQGVSDPLWYCVLINKDEARKLCEWEPYRKFMVPEMENILNFLDAYQVQGMTPYYPDRILLWVQAGRSPYTENLPEKAIPWDKNLLTLETSGEKIVYAEGDDAKEIFALFDNEVSTIVVSQDNVEYTVSIDIVLPHEQLQLQP